MNIDLYDSSDLYMIICDLEELERNKKRELTNIQNLIDTCYAELKRQMTLED